MMKFISYLLIFFKKKTVNKSLFFLILHNVLIVIYLCQMEVSLNLQFCHWEVTESNKMKSIKLIYDI